MRVLRNALSPGRTSSLARRGGHQHETLESVAVGNAGGPQDGARIGGKFGIVADGDATDIRPLDRREGRQAECHQMLGPGPIFRDHGDIGGQRNERSIGQSDPELQIIAEGLRQTRCQLSGENLVGQRLTCDIGLIGLFG